MSFPIIEKLGGEVEALAILKAARLSASSDSIRMWKGRGMSAAAQLAFTNEAHKRGVKYEPSDFIYQPEEPQNG